MILSSRIPDDVSANALTAALDRCRRAGERILDLTASNPTTAGFAYPEDLLRPLADARGLEYAPHPFGLRAAREAVSSEFGRRGALVDPEHVVLSASTSESYSWIFKLLCNPGDAVLVPQPSYPLFEHLARFEAVQALPYRLTWHGRWQIDFEAIEHAPTHTRAVLLVSPNNPTGTYIPPAEFQRLAGLCRARNWAIVADEVFADYPLDCATPTTDLFVRSPALTFTLGGASKSLGLPQVKLGWMAVGGEDAERSRALAGLELIADTYLSVNTPVQVGAADLLRRGAAVRAAIHARIRGNLSRLRQLASAHPACEVLPVDGGWSVLVRIPATRPEDAFVLELLTGYGTLVHPGYFFDLPHEAFVVLSLLPPADVFAEGATRMLAFADS